MSWTPHLAEKDARNIATHVVTELHALGGHIGRFSIFLEPEGFYFVADINGYTVQAQTGLLATDNDPRLQQGCQLPITQPPLHP